MRTRRSNGPRAKVAESAAVLALGLLAFGCSSAEQRAAPPTRPEPVTHEERSPQIVHPHDRPVPILLYHVIGPAPPGAPFPLLYTSRSEFAAQLVWLHRHGYTAVSLRRVYDYWRRGYALPRRPIVLTFDDGYRADYTVVRRLLLRYRWPGVLNLAVQNVLDRKLTLPQLRALVRAGWEIDAHTLTHPDLTTLDAAELRRQVAGSRDWIRRRLHVPVEFFSYPSGAYDARVIAAVRAAGFRGATATRPGYASPRDGLYALDRIRMDAGDGTQGLAAKLRWFR